MSKKRNLDLARDEMTLASAARYLGCTPSALSHLKTRGKLNPRRHVGRSPIYDVRALDYYAANWDDVRVDPYEAEEMCSDATHSSIRSAARAGKILYCYQIGNRWQISVNGLRKAGLLDAADKKPEQTSLDVDGEKGEETIESLRRRIEILRAERDEAVREMKAADSERVVAINDRMRLEEENEQMHALVEDRPVDLAAAERLADTRRILREIGQTGGGRLPDLINLLDALDALDADDRPAFTPGGDY
jgi:hypothetical protein